MSAFKKLICIAFGCISPLIAAAQTDIPIGTFRLHVSYNAIHDIALDGTARAYAAATHGIQIVDRVNGETSTLSKANGLSGGTITSIVFDAETRKLIITYSAGYIDVVTESQTVTQFNPASNSTLTGSRRINDAAVFNKVAYLATDYGVVVFDLVKNQVRETWRGLGNSGQPLAVQHCAIRADSTFLSTPQGILAGKMTDNLQDFSKWKRYQLWPFASPVKGLAIWRDTVYAAVDNVGLFKLVSGIWKQLEDIPADEYFSLDASGTLALVAKSGIFRFNPNEVVERLSSPLFASPRFAAVDGTGKIWIGDKHAGMLSDVNGSYTSFLPLCPANETISRLHYADGKVFAVGGGYDDTRMPLHKEGVVDIFEGTWSAASLPAEDLVDVAWDESAQLLYAASYGAGVVTSRRDFDPVVFNEQNSTLTKATTPVNGVLVTSLAKSKDGMLAINYAVNPVLHHQDASGHWTSYSIPVSGASHSHRMVVDGNDNCWMIVDPGHGGGVVVFNRHDGQAKLLTDAPGQGALPSMTVYALRPDRDGSMWIGTASGVAYIPNAATILQSPVDAIRPITDGRFALREEVVTAIEVDGGNRKWFGTRRGLWLFNATGDQPIGSFTDQNSMLPSGNILDLAINHRSGEVFIATDHGLASYRSAATEPLTTSGPVKIFPNPVPATFVGAVGITGTPADAIVKITDVSGKLVWETRASGSTASWNLSDTRGRRVPSGVYVIFTVSDNGDQHEVGKLAVIN